MINELPELTPELVVKLLAEGRTQQSIATEYDVTRSWISELARRGNREPGAKLPVAENLPWDVDLARHESNLIYQTLRVHTKAQLVGFDSAIDGERKSLLALYQILDRFNAVVDFDPKLEPIPLLSSTGGFGFVPREPEDEGWIIRMKPGVRITELGKTMWAWPDTLPE